MREKIIEIDGVQVFTANYVFEQMQAQNRRMDRINILVTYSYILAFAAILTTVAAIILSALR